MKYKVRALGGVCRGGRCACRPWGHRAEDQPQATLQGNLGLRSLCRALGWAWKRLQWGPTLGLEVGDQLHGYFCEHRLCQCLPRSLPGEERQGQWGPAEIASPLRPTFYTQEGI